MSQNVPKSVLSRLTGRKLTAAEALLAGCTKEEAAAAAGVTLRTLNRYLRDPEFAGALQEATSAELAGLATTAAGALWRARAVLLGLMDDPNVSPTVRLRAAQAVLDSGLRLYETYDLARRVAALEQEAQGDVTRSTRKA